MNNYTSDTEQEVKLEKIRNLSYIQAMGINLPNNEIYTYSIVDKNIDEIDTSGSRIEGCLSNEKIILRLPPFVTQEDYSIKISSSSVNILSPKFDIYKGEFIDEPYIEHITIKKEAHRIQIIPINYRDPLKLLSTSEYCIRNSSDPKFRVEIISNTLFPTIDLELIKDCIESNETYFIESIFSYSQGYIKGSFQKHTPLFTI